MEGRPARGEVEPDERRRADEQCDDARQGPLEFELPTVHEVETGGAQERNEPDEVELVPEADPREQTGGEHGCQGSARAPPGKQAKQDPKAEEEGNRDRSDVVFEGKRVGRIGCQQQDAERGAAGPHHASAQHVGERQAGQAQQRRQHAEPDDRWAEDRQHGEHQVRFDGADVGEAHDGPRSAAEFRDAGPVRRQRPVNELQPRYDLQELVLRRPRQVEPGHDRGDVQQRGRDQRSSAPRRVGPSQSRNSLGVGQILPLAP